MIVAAIVACGSTWAAEADDPQAVVVELLNVYGKRADSNSYIPALAAMVRIEQLEREGKPQAIAEFAQSASFSSEFKSQPEMAGRLLFASIARSQSGSAREATVAQLKRVADRLLQPDGTTVKPPGPQEMSDAVFMCGPLLCEVGSLTGDAVYFDAACEYLAQMAKLRQRDDGLYRHGHLCDAAWGRGNGFPAVGQAWCLSRLPGDHPRRTELIERTRRHLAALMKHQIDDGLWRQVIDEPSSYPEFSATTMIGFALERGMKLGWLDAETFREPCDRAWKATTERIRPGGVIIDVCEGTGTQKSLDDYLKRKTIRGVDARGGAMGLLFANERIVKP